MIRTGAPSAIIVRICTGLVWVRSSIFAAPAAIWSGK
jgi:hypothetical protein